MVVFVLMLRVFFSDKPRWFQLHDMHSSVKIKCSDQSRSSWERILRILRSYNLKCSKLTNTSDGFFAYFSNENDADLLFSESTIAELERAQCTPIKPPFVKSNRTVIVKYADRYILDFSKEELMESLNVSNSAWLHVVDLFKFPSGKAFKFECQTSKMAQLCLQSGFFVANLSINSNSIALEEFHHVKYCFRCYAINSHVAAKCSKPEDYTACSICASLEHTYKNCESDVKKCLNCDGNHVTMSKMCKEFKETLSTRVTSSTRPTPSYKQVTGQNLAEMPVKYGLSREDMFRGFMSIVYASSVDADRPGTFSENLMKLLHANKLPTFATADIEPPNMTAHFNRATEENSTGYYNSVVQPASNENLNSTEYSGDISPPVTESPVTSLENERRPLRTSVCVKNKTQVSTRNHVKKCQIYVRKGSKFSKGKIIDLINDRKVAIEHSCMDETKCITMLSKKVLSGDISGLQVIELPDRKFDSKYSIFMTENN